MARLELSIDVSYQSETWGLWEAFREIASNAYDAQTKFAPEGRGAMTCRFDHPSKEVVVRTAGVTLDREVLLMGSSGSRGRTDLIGRFGEGLPMALLTLARMAPGITVTVFNGNEKWEPVIERSEVYRADVVVVKTRSGVKDCGGFEVRIGGLPYERWEEFRDLMLWLDPKFDKAQAFQPVPYNYARVLTDKRYKGCIFNKGVFVCKRSDLEWGFDLDMPLNRDRHMVDEWSLKYTLTELVSRCVEKFPEVFQARVIRLMETGAETPELASSYIAYHTPLASAAEASFKAKHGDESVPVADLAQARELEFVGRKGVVVSPAFQTLLAGRMQGFHEAKKVAGEKAVSLHQWGDLTEDERAVLLDACKMVCSSSTLTVAGVAFPAKLEVVSFAEGKLMGRFNKETGVTQIARSVLASKLDTLTTLVHEACHLFAGDGEHEHTEQQVAVLGEIALAAWSRQ